MTPPTAPGPFTHPQPPRAWPGVVGTFMIVLGSLAALGGCIGAFAPFMAKQMFSMMQGLPGAADMSAAEANLERFKYANVTASAVMMGLGIWCIVGGARLVGRNPQARATCIAWSWSKLAFALAYSVLTYVMQRANLTALPKDPNLPAFTQAMLDPIAKIALVVTFLWYAGLPVFLLIWLTRKSIVAEIGGWRKPEL